MSNEVIKLALEALKHIHPSPLTSFYTIGDRDKAIKALKEALTKQEQDEPVMTVRIWRDNHGDQTAEFRNWHTLPDGEHSLYTTPQSAQKRWVGLTDDERGICINSNFGTGLWLMAKDVEAKLKEKNT